MSSSSGSSSSNSSGDDIQLRLLSTLLNELDGISSVNNNYNSNSVGRVLLLGATNR
jgi:SpoVK/Ycf46/Vps4 family AAA+-type ATPase